MSGNQRYLAAVAIGAFDLVITTCDEAREACPLFPRAKLMLHWSFPDPAAVKEADERFKAFRAVRDGLREEIAKLAAISEGT